MLLVILESAARAAILISLVWAGLKLLRVRNPHIELAIWSAVLIAALAMPVLMKASPLTLTAPAAITETLDIAPDGIPVILNTPSAAVLDENVAPLETPTVPPVPWLMVIAGAYAAVAGVLAVRLLFACMLVWRLRQKAHVAVAAEAPDLAVRMTDALTSPVTVGTTILLPAAFPTWPREKRAAVLFHEGVHAARGDFYVHLLASLHCALFWFSPLAWWLRKHLVELSEITSDDSAVKKLGNHTAYAEILLDLSREAQKPVLGAAMAWRPTVLGRIHRLLDHYRPASPVSRRLRWAATAATIPVIGLVTGSLAAAPAQSLMLDELKVAFDAQAISVTRPFIPAVPSVARIVPVSAPNADRDIPVAPVPAPISAHTFTVADAKPSAPAVASLPATESDASLCIENVRKADLLLIVDPRTVIVSMPGQPYRRVTVVNDPNDKPERSVKEPTKMCVGDKVDPLGIERGMSFIAAIEDISETEFQTLREARNARVTSSNSLSVGVSGHTARVCNKGWLTPVQMGLCVEAMESPQAQESLEDFKQNIRATIKRRQAYANRRQPLPREFGNFYNSSSWMNAPGSDMPPGAGVGDAIGRAMQGH